MRHTGIAVLGVLLVLLSGLGTAPLAAQESREPPYYASIAASKARMRTGPGRTYPAAWLYVRDNLPIKVVAKYQDWRKIEDPDGTQGWMLVSLLSAARTAMVVGTIVEMREAPRHAAAVMWRAEPGVVGKISECQRGWCYFDVRGRAGYVEHSHLWGVDPGENIP